ncbi:pyrroline-5-carboxylate reductase [Sporolactobacillus sp. THM7-7]|nr:pyrroline-5-carboxylate reductase [Sporolactobacillus sp. THM7-7]
MTFFPSVSIMFRSCNLYNLDSIHRGETDLLEKIVFIGAGAVAESLIKGFLDKDFITPDRIWVNNHSNTDRLKELEEAYSIRTTQDKQAALKNADVVFLAFKPKDTAEALESMKGFMKSGQLFISLMAGVPSDYIVSVTGQPVSIIRAMPNTPASIGLSATGIAAGSFASAEQLCVAKELFETVGTVSIVQESAIDIMTGLSGSGPAYLYYLAEAMKEAGVGEGLSEDEAARLVKQTLKGAAALLHRSGKTPGELLQAVATPGGTTEAGVNTLNRHQAKEAVIDCVHQAVRRARELSDPFST